MSLLTDNSTVTGNLIDATPKIDDQFSVVRDEARAALESLKLPAPKAEEYKFTPITRILEKAFPSWPTSRPDSSITDIGKFIVGGEKADVAVLVNGRFDAKLSRLGNSGAAVKQIGPERTALLFKQADFSRDPLVALNTMSWTDGVEILVADNIKASTPVIVLNLVDSSKGPVTTHSRLVVHVGNNASLSIIARNACIGEHPSFATMVEEVLVGERGQLDYCRIQNEKQEISFNHTSIRQLSESHVNTFTLTLDGKLVRNNLHIAIDGQKTESHFHGLYLLNGDTIADNHTVVDHRMPNSFSNEMYKGVMDGNAKGVFNGKIYVRPDAQKTNAFQSNRNILLSDGATINTKPQLEIWADDVKCSHGCTTGQLDEEAMFYLRSRGIPKVEARAMLLYAFAAETFSFIRNESLKDHVNSLVVGRLSKGV